MLKNATYKEKFFLLKPFFSILIEDIKTDLKNDHLKKDNLFCKQYLPGKNISKVNSLELADAYASAIETSEQSENIGEFISHRWLLKNSELYNFFESVLQKIDPNFTELEILDFDKSKQIMQDSIRFHGAIPTYFFSVINSVVFPKEIYDELAQQARIENSQSETAELQAQEILKSENMQKQHEQQIARLTDKYEKKLAGLQKKYLIDTENLKKQIAHLHRKGLKN